MLVALQMMRMIITPTLTPATEGVRGQEALRISI
jgi:hypothetical protein